MNWESVNEHGRRKFNWRQARKILHRKRQEKILKTVRSWKNAERVRYLEAGDILQKKEEIGIYGFLSLESKKKISPILTFIHFFFVCLFCFVLLFVWLFFLFLLCVKKTKQKSFAVKIEDWDFFPPEKGILFSWKQTNLLLLFTFMFFKRIISTCLFNFCRV